MILYIVQPAFFEGRFLVLLYLFPNEVIRLSQDNEEFLVKSWVISYDIIRKMIYVVEQAEFWDGGWTYVSGSTSKNG